MATPVADAYIAASGAAVYGGRYPSGAIVTGSVTLDDLSSSGTVVGYAAPAPVSDIVQFLTSDGGTATGSGNLSSPTREYWHSRLGFQWKRTNVLGNWLDSAQTEEGTVAYGSSAALTTLGQVASITVTALVSRWMSNGLNRGFYLKARSSAWPIYFHGRTASVGDRPVLTVVTSTSTFTLTAAANAHWNISTYSGYASSLQWALANGSNPAILRFDLSTVTGTVSSATLTFKVSAFDTGHTGHIIDVFECDPPTIIVPEDVPSPVYGLAANYDNFNALKASGLSSLKFIDDFESPGSMDSGFVPSATRTYDANTGTTYARGTISAGSYLSMNIRQDVSTGTGPGGTPNVVYDEMYSQYNFYMESDFGTTAETAIKIPAMGVQFGYWNPTAGGYWQQTTGNGGTPGTGLKVAGSGSTGGNFEYQGHSVRFLTGIHPAALDDDPYRGWYAIAIYPYNLDQGGPFPGGENFPMIAIRNLKNYCIDIRVRQNTMTGAQDGLGNYATANADGIYQVWINGYLAYSKTNFRWRKHAEMGVQGWWGDVYHGGIIAAPYDMHYRIDRICVATEYIGPARASLSGTVTLGDITASGSVTGNSSWPFTIPASNTIGAISSNTLNSLTADPALQFSFPKILASWGTAGISLIKTGSVITDFIYYIFGGGHGDTGNDGVYGFRASTGLMEVLLAHTHIAPGGLIDVTYGENIFGRPESQHCYQNFLGLDSDEANGPSYMQLRGTAISNGATLSGQAHKFDALTNTWSRYGSLKTGLAANYCTATIKDTTRQIFIRFPSNNANDYHTLDYTQTNPTWVTGTQAFRAGGWGDTYTATGIYDPVDDSYIAGHQRGVGANFRFLDAATPTGTWTELTFTGTGPTNSYGTGLQYRAINDTFVLIDQTSAPPTGVWVLTPDRTGRTSAARPWAWSRIAFSGTSHFVNNAEAFNRFIYVPDIDALIVCPAAGYPMEMWKF